MKFDDATNELLAEIDAENRRVDFFLHQQQQQRVEREREQQPLIHKVFDPGEREQQADDGEPTESRMIDSVTADLMGNLADEIGVITGGLERAMKQTDERMLARIDALSSRLDRLTERLDTLANDLNRSSVVTPLKRGNVA